MSVMYNQEYVDTLKERCNLLSQMNESLLELLTTLINNRYGQKRDQEYRQRSDT